MKRKLTPSKARAMLLELAEWFDNPNQTPQALYVKVITGEAWTAGFMLRQISDLMPRSSAKKKTK